MPYNPGITDRSGEILMRGLSGFGRGVSQGVYNRGLADEREMERQRQDAQVARAEATQAQDEAKKRKRLFDALVTQAEVSGLMSKEEASTMSLEQLKGRVDGEATKQTLMKNKQAIQKGAMELAAMQSMIKSQQAFQKDLDARINAGVTVDANLYNQLRMKHNIGSPDVTAQMLPRKPSPMDVLKANTEAEKVALDAEKLNHEKAQFAAKQQGGGWKPQVMELEGLPGKKLVQTTENSWQVVDAQSGKEVGDPIDPIVLEQDEDAVRRHIATLSPGQLNEFAKQRRDMFGALRQEDPRDKMIRQMMERFLPAGAPPGEAPKPAETRKDPPGAQSGNRPFGQEPYDLLKLWRTQ